MKRFCSIISCFLAITILISSSVVTVHAASVSPFTAPFWVWAGNKAQEEATSDEGYVGYLDYLKAAFSRKDSGCTSSQSKNGCHYWQLISDLPVSSITGKFRVKCQYCGMYYADYSSCDPEKEAETAYANNVSTLPATGYNSAGKLLWQPSFMDAVDVDGGTSQCREFGFVVNAGGYYSIISGFTPGFVSTDIQKLDGASVSIIGSKMSLDLTSTSNFYDVTINGTGGARSPTRLYFLAPIAGSYSVVSSPFVTAQLETGRLTNLITTTEYTWRPALVNSGNPYGAGGRLSMDLYWNDASGKGIIPGNGISLTGARKHITFSTPIFQITPASSITTTINNTYNINTRVNNFQGNYYNNVTNNYYNNTTIINETTNNYYDMTTNNYYTMSNWSYDYQSRTYFVTLEDGTTITVQFGDDCLTITNNNVENSYQYVINNSTPSPNPETPSTCKHNWTETIDVEPTCLEGGHANFTCSLCGETYEQILSAKGHNWTVKEHVNTVYGENGVIVTQGHTLYECSACGEQWYTETATPPPDVSGGSSIRSWLQAFQLWLDGKLDSLFSAADAPIIARLDAILAELQSAPGSAACEHTYTQHTEQEATCTLPGLLIFTCSQCGDSYSEIVDPLGHDWIVTSHVDAVTDPETGEETASAYDVYTCSRCQRTYEDHDGSGPEEDYSSSSISKLVVKAFSRLGTFAGKLIGSVIHLFDKAITALDNVVSKFNEYVEQISGFGGGYPAWLTGFWGVLPAELQVALTFAVICMALGVVGKKLFFS